MHEALSGINIPHWFISGTCLGLLREGNVIEGDADIDIAIPYSCNDNIQVILGELYHKLGCKQVSEMSRDGKFENLGLDCHGISYEFNFLHSNDTVSWITWLENCRQQWNALEYPNYMFASCRYICGVPVPCFTEKFISMTYGDDWATPNKDYYNSPEGFYLTGKPARRYNYGG